MSAWAVVNGMFNASNYLLPRQISNVTNAGAAFDSAQSYYQSVQDALAALPINANARIIYTDGLEITCNSFTDLYHVAIDATTYSTVNWFSLIGCRFSAAWVIDVTGSGDVTIKGQPFPAIVERAVYNILGTGRTISGQTGIAGHILSPGNTYTSSAGLVYGNLIVGDIATVLQVRKPNCINFADVTISTKVTKAVVVGDTTIYVADLAQFIVGDVICITGDCRTVVSGEFVADGENWQAVINVATGYNTAAPEGTFVTTDVTNPEAATRDTVLAVKPSNAPAGPGASTSSGSILVASFLAFASLLL